MAMKVSEKRRFSKTMEQKCRLKKSLKRRVGMKRFGTVFVALCLAANVINFVGPSNLAWAATSKKEEGEQKLKEVRGQTKEVKAEAEKVKKQIDEQKEEIAKIEEQIIKYDEEIGKLNQKIEENENYLKKHEKDLHQKLVRIYMSGENAHMARLFAANSFAEFLHRYEVLRLIVKEDAKAFNKYIDIIQDLEKSQLALNQAKEEQSSLLEEAQKKVEKLNQVYEKHKNELAKLEKEEEKILREYAGYFSGGSGYFFFPTTPGPVSWNFGQDRGTHRHKGIDIARPAGTPIYAAADGVVELIKSDPKGYGVYIIINHGNGLKTLYAHMYRSTITVSVGQRVYRGQRIAGVGNNGRWYGTNGGYHLHFEVHKNGVPVNPRNYL